MLLTDALWAAAVAEKAYQTGVAKAQDSKTPVPGCDTPLASGELLQLWAQDSVFLRKAALPLVCATRGAEAWRIARRRSTARDGATVAAQRHQFH